MATIYLDHNIISRIAGIPAAPNAADEQQHAFALKQAGHRFALSAWNMYELARSTNDQHIDQCCTFVEALDPVWVSNNVTVQRQEVARFVNSVFNKVEDVAARTVTPIYAFVSQMWATYGGVVFVGETFRGTVRELRADPGFIENIVRAAAETPDAISIARRAIEAGALQEHQFIIDRDYVAARAPRRTTPAQIDYLASHLKDLIDACPAVAVEEILTQIRAHDCFKPEPADGPDLQHAITPLAYCDYFVSNDKRLRRHCRIAVEKLGANCQTAKSIGEVAPLIGQIKN